jgi:hypothetical protein
LGKRDAAARENLHSPSRAAPLSTNISSLGQREAARFIWSSVACTSGFFFIRENFSSLINTSVAKKVETHLSRSRTHTHHCVFFTAHNIRFTLVPARNPCPACVRLSRSHPPIGVSVLYCVCERRHSLFEHFCVFQASDEGWGGPFSNLCVCRAPIIPARRQFCFRRRLFVRSQSI